MPGLKKRPILLEVFSRLNIVLAKTEVSNIFRREEMGSIKDIAFVSDTLAKNPPPSKHYILGSFCLEYEGFLIYIYLMLGRTRWRATYARKYCFKVQICYEMQCIWLTRSWNECILARDASIPWRTGSLTRRQNFKWMSILKYVYWWEGDVKAAETGQNVRSYTNYTNLPGKKSKPLSQRALEGN